MCRFCRRQQRRERSRRVYNKGLVPSRGRPQFTGAMGIKFHCPNGHKLNVKSFLAGKKGVCPKCGTKVRIPEASEPGLGGDDAEDSDDGKDEKLGGNGALPTPIAVQPMAVPAPGPAQPVQMPAPVAVRPVNPAPAQAVMPVQPVQPAMPVAAPAYPAPAMPAAMQPAVGDPIAQAPMAIWYVRPPSGGQFGPARGDVMRKWIAEGRVSSDSLVWREGWTDWQNAGKLFPNLLASTGAATPAAAPATGVTRATRTVNRYQSKKSGGNSMGVAILIFLAIVCVVLVAVLAIVLFNMNSPAPMKP